MHWYKYVYSRSDWHGHVPEDMDKAKNKIDQDIKPNIKMRESEPFDVGNEWSEQVVGNEYDWSEAEVGKHK